MDEYDESDFDLGPQEPDRDRKIDEAKTKLLEFFVPQSKQVYYERQLQVLFEKQFFHWITVDALHELVEEKKIETEVMELQDATRIRFYWSPANRYWRRRAKQIISLVRQYSDSDFTAALGAHGEMMFDAALPTIQFTPVARDVRQYQGRVWTATGKNLDRIFIRDQIAYGVEIKNTLDYIPREEFRSKLQMCKFLGIRPLFILRYAPKNYIWDVIKAGAYCLIFQDQLYSLGYKRLARIVKTDLGLPVDCPKTLEAGLLSRLDAWHIRKLDPTE
jgi:hypothetical protein